MTKRLWIWTVVVPVVVVVALVVGGWYVVTRQWSTTPSEADVVGVWQRDDSDMRITIYPSDKSDGTGKITFTNIPKGMVTNNGETGDNTSTPVTVTGTRQPFTNLGWAGPVASPYDFPNGEDGTINSTGNGLFGYQLRLIGGNGAEYRFEFHRISTQP